MSVPFSGTFAFRGGVVSAISRELRRASLRPVRRIDVAFDPFSPAAVNARDFIYYVSGPKLGNTNPMCVIKTNIVCDRREPTISFKLEADYAEKFGSEVITFKSNNLTCLDILSLYNKHITSLIPKEKPVEIIATKQERKKR